MKEPLNIIAALMLPLSFLGATVYAISQNWNWWAAIFFGVTFMIVLSTKIDTRNR